jgi:hypothetical protein
MFFPMFVVGVLLFAGLITGLLAGAALVYGLLRRHYCAPLWLPTTAVFLLTTAIVWIAFSAPHPAIPPIAGGIVSLAFVVHWAAISTVWFLPRLLFRVLDI